MNSSFPKRVGALLAAVLSMQVGFGLSASPNNPGFHGHTEGPDLHLGGVTSGRDAVNALGGNLGEVARRHGLDGSQLALRLATDPALHVDRSGHLLYGCDGVATRAPKAAAGAKTLGGATAGVAPQPLANTFLLHSLPASTLKVFLDFDGNTTAGTLWNNSFTRGTPIVTPPFDLDGNPAAFSDAELTRIQLIWQRVAEDYAVFGVDVTTEDPGVEGLRRTSNTDTAYGIHVCIGGSSTDWYGSAGGVSFVGSFDWSSDTPNFVFPAQLGGGDEKYTAEAIAHEVGHSFNLNHDGQSPSTEYYAGQGVAPMTWAPIMGVSYYANITQFSKGEYTGANNTEDDLAKIAGYVGYRADDFGDTMATATLLPAGATLSASGIISGQTDVDVIAFTTGAGVINLNLTSGTEDADLDLSVELRDSTGALIGASNPASSLGAAFVLTVPAGTYYLFISGAGYLEPLLLGYSSYGSIGTYQLTGTVPNPSGGIAPIAVATANPTAGVAPLTVTFTGTASSDPDGFITSYAWSFSDGSVATGATVTKTLTTAGNWLATLKVTDNSGLSSSAGVVVSVSAPVPNLPPVASFTATPSSGYGPLTVAFDASSSSDPDGTIATYAWNYGDGTTGTGKTTSHVYTALGTFTSLLTVTDNKGLKSSVSIPIAVLQDPTKIIRVQSIVLSVAAGRAKSLVKVTDLAGNPVSLASVGGKWSGASNGNVSATTDATGVATLTTSGSLKTGTLTFTVTSVGKSGVTYDATKNIVTSTSIQAAPTAH